MSRFAWTVEDANTGAVLKYDAAEFNGWQEPAGLAAMGDAAYAYIVANESTLPDVVNIRIVNETASVELLYKKYTKKDGHFATVPPGTPDANKPLPAFDWSWVLYLGLGLAIVVALYWAYRRGL